MRNRSHSIILTAVLFVSCSAAGMTSAAELGDAGFEALAGKTVGREAVPGQWSIPPGQPFADGIDVKADPLPPAAARRGSVAPRVEWPHGGGSPADSIAIRHL